MLLIPILYLINLQVYHLSINKFPNPNIFLNSSSSLNHRPLWSSSLGSDIVSVDTLSKIVEYDKDELLTVLEELIKKGKITAKIDQMNIKFGE